MPIQQLTPMEEIERYTEERLERFRQAVIRTLFIIGERCINKARRDGNYKDQTGNLRSSIGYVISVDGQVISYSDFQSVKSSGRGGSKEGLKFAREIAKEYPNDMCLIVVAGMKYAAYVSAKGYDVIEGAELLAEEQAKKLLKQLEFH